MADDPDSTTKALLKWASGQPFNNLLLILILGAFAWVSHHVLTVSVPAHLQQIQDGYERIEKSSSEDRMLIIEQYDKWFDFIQKSKTGDSTGHVAPENIIEELWNQSNESNDNFSSVVGARGIAHSPLDAAAEGWEQAHIVSITTPEGTVVTWNDSGRVTARLQASGRRRVKKSSGESRRSSGAFDASKTQPGILSEFAKSNSVF